MPPRPPTPPQRETPGSEHRHQANVAVLIWRATDWAIRSGIRRGSGQPGPAYRSAGRDGLMRRACWNRKSPGPPRSGWGSKGKRRPWDGWRGTPFQRPTAAAGQGRRRHSRQPLRAPRWMGQCRCCSLLPWLRLTCLLPLACWW
jgi:hypothetical protein